MFQTVHFGETSYDICPKFSTLFFWSIAGVKYVITEEPTCRTASTYISFSCPNSGLNSYVFLLYFLPSFHWGKKSAPLCAYKFSHHKDYFFCWTISIECGMKHCKCFFKSFYWLIIATLGYPNGPKLKIHTYWKFDWGTLSYIYSLNYV